MKKLSLLILALILVFVSCQQDHIFYDISQEIELNKPSIGGKVASIKNAGDSLYAINGMLNYKSMDAKRWSKVQTPAGKISSVAVGDKKLYILIGSTVYATDLDEDGKIIDYPFYKVIENNVSRLFDNQAKTVYCIVAGKLNEITHNNSEITATLTPVETPTLVGVSSEAGVVAALSADSKDYFFGTTACAIVEDGTNFYFASTSGTEIKYGSNPDELNTKSTDSVITSMTIYDDNLYVGTQSGAFVYTIQDKGSLSDRAYLSGNAESAFGDRKILGIWKFDNGDNFFVSVTATSSSLYDALWGYDSSIDKWNLE